MTDPVQPPDPNRRRFFRQFAGDVVSSMGSVLGAAQMLQQQSAEAARDLLGTTEPVPVAGPASARDEDARLAGFRAAFRWDGDVCRVVDQRRLPDILADIEVRGTVDTVHAINDGALVGAEAQAQVAAITVALVARHASQSRPFARRATIRGAASALRMTRQGAASLAFAMDRQVALVESLPPDPDGELVAGLLREEAESIITEAAAEHGALVAHAIAALPDDPNAPLRILTLGSSGAMGGGQLGTALSVIIALHHAGRPVRALVAETRPLFSGSRIAAWELRQAGVQHAIVVDAAAPRCIAAGEVDAVLVAADRVAANGDVIADAGTYPLALAAAAAGVPFLVCAPTTAIDPAVPDGAAATIEEGRPSPVLWAAGTRIAPEGTQIRSPLQDLTPGSLVTMIITGEGVHRAPFGPALAEAAAAADARRTAPGFAALVAKRAAAAGAPAGEAAREPAPVAPADVAPADVAPADVTAADVIPMDRDPLGGSTEPGS